MIIEEFIDILFKTNVKYDQLNNIYINIFGNCNKIQNITILTMNIIRNDVGKTYRTKALLNNAKRKLIKKLKGFNNKEIPLKMEYEIFKLL